MALATLSIDLVAKLASLEEGFSKATRLAEKNAAAIEARWAKVGGTIKSVAGIIGVGFTVRTFGQFIAAAHNGVDALNDLRDATGSTIENLSALEDVAARTGTPFESMASTLVKFNKVLSDAKPGSDVENILKSLGLEAKKLQDLDPAEALRQAAVALSLYSDRGGKARAVQELFGKSVQEAAPLLKDLSEQGSLNATVTTKQAEEAEKFNKQLFELRKGAVDAARSLTNDLVPALNKLFEAQKRKGFIGGIADLLGFDDKFFDAKEQAALGAKLRSLNDEKKLLEEQLRGDFTNAETPQRRTRLSVIVEKELPEAIAQYKSATAQFLRLNSNAGAGRGSVNPEFVKPDLNPTTGGGGKKAAQDISEAQRALAQYVSQLEREFEVTQDLSEEQKALNFLKGLGTLGEVPQVRALVLGLAAQNDQLREQADLTKLNAEAEKERARQRAESQRALSALLEQTPTAQYEKLVDLSAQLDDAFANGQVTGQKYAEALRGIDDALKSVEPEAKKAQEATKTFAEQAARNIQDSLGDTVLATLKGDFDSIGRLWGNLIQKMIAEALAAKLGEALLGNFAQTGKIGGGIGSLLSIFGFHSGGVVGRDGAPYRYHSGGVAGLKPDEVPAVLQVGEEVITRSDPRHRDNRSPSGMTIINNVQAGVTRNEMLAALSAAMQTVRGEFQQKLRLAGVA